ncbi:UDP-N-acetylglucosamine 4,6-dehydratase [Gammaproteobacteria bacterium]|nr:UDP-N-acetylglucosamine 4,6-dehydratase [Gammaproteobacteria bacterium]
MNPLNLIGRSIGLFDSDLKEHEERLLEAVSGHSFLVIGGAGSIGQSVAIEIFKRDPRLLHVVDISENNLVELVREIRSTLGYIRGEFATFALDCGAKEFEALMKSSDDSYDYVLNLSALKHVRSEQDPYTIMRMLEVNIFNPLKTISLTLEKGTSKYFCVSTDKAANPVNIMGASKRVMEMFLLRESKDMCISMARFANVAFSDGSLLHGFNQRFSKRQPIAAPMDVRRYFVTLQESGELCLLSCLLGDNREIFFPKLDENLHFSTFSDIAIKYLRELGYDAYECSTEDEARQRAGELIKQKKWPCYFFQSDTTGEKYFEEFYTDKELLDINRFQSIGVILNEAVFDNEQLDEFSEGVRGLRNQPSWTKREILSLLTRCLPDFDHNETGKYLDEKM